MNDTQEKIIKAARDLFEVNGYAAATTKEIAAKAGVSEVTLFRHFETKRNLFEQTVHQCMHPYKLNDYLDNKVEYDLEKDLKYIAKNMLKTYQQNLPLIKMVFKDKMQGSLSKAQLRKHDDSAKLKLRDYFEQMYKLGKLNAEPIMAVRFFTNNIVGFFMKNIFSLEAESFDVKYFDWMLERVIFALKNFEIKEGNV